MQTCITYAMVQRIKHKLLVLNDKYTHKAIHANTQGRTEYNATHHMIAAQHSTRMHGSTAPVRSASNQTNAKHYSKTAQQTMHSIQRRARTMQHTCCNTHDATHALQHARCNTHAATCTLYHALQHSRCNTQAVIHKLQHALHHARCNTHCNMHAATRTAIRKLHHAPKHAQCNTHCKTRITTRTVTNTLCTSLRTNLKDTT
jgi:hypothetical protein